MWGGTYTFNTYGEGFLLSIIVSRLLLEVVLEFQYELPILKWIEPIDEASWSCYVGHTIRAIHQHPLIAPQDEEEAKIHDMK